MNVMETAEKEVQDTSCRGSGGVPQLQKPPEIGGYRGLIERISALSRGYRRKKCMQFVLAEMALILPHKPAIATLNYCRDVHRGCEINNKMRAL